VTVGCGPGSTDDPEHGACESRVSPFTAQAASDLTNAVVSTLQGMRRRGSRRLARTQASASTEYRLSLRGPRPLARQVALLAAATPVNCYAATAKCAVNGKHVLSPIPRVKMKERVNMAPLDWSNCPAVESIPGKVSGAWVLKGTRMPVQTIFENLEAGMSVKEITEVFDVTEQEIKAVLRFASQSLETSPVHG
jgi:uncharacterized protein (DUF433 family)